MITIKNSEQIELMRQAGRLLYEVLQMAAHMVKPGVSTKALNDAVDQMIRDHHAEPSFFHYEGFPASLCTSVNDCVVHGIPSKKEILREGDIISLDCGVKLNGWQSDSALTVGVGEISKEAQALIRRTEECFFEGARRAVAGNRLGDIGHAVQQHAEKAGYGVVRDLSGHGIGREMHEDPAVYNYGIEHYGAPVKAGMTIAIEPMITLGDWHVESDEDGWFFRTLDGSISSHYEHTIAVMENGLPEILTLPGFHWEGEN
ncbi:MAG: type I methionyl aminopeptidase [Clostridia bacterium]|nr:type I methionyl aminopeptidase [Clostridia bacterium]